MTPNVVQIVMQALSPEVTAGAAERLDEQPGAVATALTAIVPGVFRLLGARVAEEGGPEALLAAIRQGGVAFSLNDPLGRLVTDGADLGPLGDEGPALAERAADFAGVGGDSASALVGMVIPLALGAVARTAPPPLNAETLGRTLREQNNNIDRAFPPAFTLGGPDPAVAAAQAIPAAPQAGARGEAPTLAAPTLAPPAQPPARAEAPDAAPSAGGLPKWLLPLLAALILLAVVFVLIRNLGGDDRGPATAPDGGAQAAAPVSGAGSP